MIRFALVLAVSLFAFAPLQGQDAESLAGKRVVFLGDSITQAGAYVSFTTYYLERLYPKKDFDVISVGLASETLSGLSEDGHAGGKFPRPCLFERLGRVLEKTKPKVVFACYGMNDGIYLPLDNDRFATFQKGVTKLIEQCKTSGVKQIFLITPPIYDSRGQKDEANYEAVLAAYSKWEKELKVPGVHVIDVHSAMKTAREGRTEPFSKDKVHPGDEGHLLMARTILAGLGVKAPEEIAAAIKADPLFQLVARKRELRSSAWMKHTGYTREKTVAPEPLGTAEADAAKLQVQIDSLRRRPSPPETPASTDNRLVVELFASAPDIVHPIALDFDAKGRLLAIESHTHFPPANYAGPKFDRIRMFEVPPGGGKASKITTFYEGTTHTMDLAVHPDGSVYLATRNEIIRLRDTKGAGVADERTRIVFLDTKGDYPHNGLSGLSFDSRGELTFGIGENLGEPYKLTGTDGVVLTGGGEGGNIFHCTADGKNLRRIATGFWNPFGSCRDIYGRLFVVDNDPDASPPCRLVHVVEGGDYGFQFRYGRAGRHPFQAWNGELPGTLPYVAGTGESPCEVVSYESDGLPAEYRGDLLVPAWADHRLERYVLHPKGASFTAERKPFIQGGKNFYPSGLTVAPDGSLFVSDWGSQSYQLHGKGAIWHVRWVDAKAANRPTNPKVAIRSEDRKTREAAARELAKTEAGRTVLRELLRDSDVRLRATALTAILDAGAADVPTAAIARSDAETGMRELAVRSLNGKSAAEFTSKEHPAAVRAEAVNRSDETDSRLVLELLASDDPYLRNAVVQRLSQPDVRRMTLTFVGVSLDKQSPQVRIGLLLACRASSDPYRTNHLQVFLGDPDPDVRFLAVKWVSDEKLAQFRPQVAEMLKSPTLDPRAYVALATTLARLDGKPVNDDSLAAYFLDRLKDRDAPPAAKLMALRAIPVSFKPLRTELLIEQLKQPDAAFRIEVLRSLKDRADPKASAAVRAIAADEKEPSQVRAQAVLTLSATETDAGILLELVRAKDNIVSREALRALTGAKLMLEQAASLQTIAASDGNFELAARVLGKKANSKRSDAKDTEAWLKFLDGKADADAGRRVFESPKLAGCYKCHRVEGRGKDIGPDLSLIGRTERKWIVESILQPSAVVAPNFQAWQVRTLDGRTRTGLLTGTYLDKSVYVDEKGNPFEVLAVEVENISAAKTSIMPDGLVDVLTDQEIRDLVAYLASRR